MKLKLTAAILTALAVIGVGSVLAGPAPQDVSRSEALAALDVLNRYFASETAGDVPTSTPRPTPTPRPTATPAPVSAGAPSFADCLYRMDVGWSWLAYDPGYRVVETLSKHVKATGVNPAEPNDMTPWIYGFSVFERAGKQVNLFITSRGEWMVRLGHKFRGTIVDTGILSRHGISITTAKGDKNRLVFRTLTPDHGYGFFVNGAEVPVNWKATGLPTEYRRYNPSRRYYINAVYGGEYEQVCAVNSW